MNPTKKRKNFLLDREIVEELQKIAYSKNKNLTGIINQYFKAILKDDSIMDRVDDIANQRGGTFIGMLDHNVGLEKWSQMKSDYHSSSKRF